MRPWGPATAVSTFPTDAWGQTCEILRSTIGDRNFASWIAPLRCTWTDGAIALEAPERGVRDMVERHFLAVIEDAARAVAGSRCEIHLTLPRGRFLPVGEVAPPADHTFETFVVGRSNARAHAVAHGMARDEGRAPLFLYGPSGVGKTHLLHAVFHALAARGTDSLCLPAAEFLASLLAAYRADAREDFWNGLEPLTALLLDDVHSLARQERTQEHLGEGLAAWVRRGRVLVLTSDRPPGEVPELAARWGDWFGAERIAHIEPPEPALRTAILHFKARALGFELDEGLAATIAAHVHGSVRRLEGALTKLLARVRLADELLDPARALEALPELRAVAAVLPTLERIVAETAAVFGVSPRALRGAGRRKQLQQARQVAMFVARKVLRRPFTELARAFGRDRTTVASAWRVVSERAAADVRLAARLARIEQRLAGARTDAPQARPEAG